MSNLQVALHIVSPLIINLLCSKLQSEDTETECSDTELERLVMNARSTVGPAKDNLMCYVGRGAKQITSFGEKVMGIA